MRRILIFCLSLSAVSLFAQAPGNIEQGFRAYGSYENDDFDSVSLSNGSLELHIPILSYPQRGDLNFSFTTRASAKNWRVNPHFLSNGQPNGGNWQYSGNGLRITFDQAIDIRVMKASYVDPNAGTKNNLVTPQIFTYVGSDGSQHTTPAAGGGLGSAPRRAFDGSGLTDNGTYVFDANGRASGIIDSNGNQVTTSSSGWTDTVGRSITGSVDTNNTYGPYFDPVSGIVEPGFVVGVPTADFTHCPAGTTIVARRWDVPAPTGTATYYLCYTHLSFVTNFGESGVTEGAYTSNFLTAIVLPNGRSWSFGFDSYGDVSSVTTPGGATITYHYQNRSTVSDVSRWITSKTVVVPSSGQTYQWSYTWIPSAPSGAFVVVRGPDGNDTAHWMTQFTGGDVRYETKTQYYQGSVTTGTVTTTISTGYTHNYNPWNDLFISQAGYSDINVLPQTITTVTSDGRTSQEVRQYDAAGSWTFLNPVANTSTTTPISYGTLLRTDLYDYGLPNSGLPGPLLRSEITRYMWQQSASYLSSNLITLPYQKTILDGSGVQIAQTTYLYDVAGQLVSSNITVSHSTPPATVRGNLSSIDQWLKGGSDPVTQYWYYDTGEKQQDQNARGNKTSYTYGQCAGSALTSSTNALNQTTGIGVDCNSGLMTTYRDVNNQPYSFTYDSMRRVTDMTLPDGGEKQFSYNDSLNQATQKVKQTSSTWITTLLQLNSLGQLAQTQLQSDPSGTTFIDYTYDGLGRVSSVSNPYRTTGDATYGITSFLYDALSRKIYQCQPDNTATPSATCNPNSAYQSWTYSGNSVTFKDEAGNQWQRWTDALGRLTGVKEPNGGSTSPSMETDYTYNALNNLTCVEQHGGVSGTGCLAAPLNDATSPWRVRRFTYDSLSRLLQAHNPETGWTCYGTTGGAAPNGSNCTSGYDANGNLQAKTDARAVTILYSYDVLNRLTGKTYTVPTPAPAGYASTLPVAYYYDESSGVYGIGRRTSMIEGVQSQTQPQITGRESWTYDPMGRIASIQRSTVTSVSPQNNPQSNPATFTYNLDGSLNLGHFFAQGSWYQYTYAGDGRPTALNWNSNIPYAYGATYAPSGQLTGLTLGGGSVSPVPITLAYAYNNRLQPSTNSASIPAPPGIATPPTSPTGPVQWLYNHVFCFSNCFTGAPPSNNGNILQDVDVATASNTSKYSYDTLNRLLTANSTSSSESNAYDAFGNLNQKADTVLGVHTSFSTTADSSNRLSGIFGYDQAGNVTTDNMGNPLNTWDAEGRLASAGSVIYGYDGDGNRVLKSNPGASDTSLGSVYWYGPDGSMTDETTVAMNGSNARDLQRNFYFSGKLVARQGFPNSFYPSIFVISDQLGSSRAGVDFRWTGSGSYGPAFTNYFPFGGYVTAPTATLDQEFTGKVRDSESSNDYFGARYYASSMGRFLSPDDGTGERLQNPQSLDRYSYTFNNPLVLVDPSGHSTQTANNGDVLVVYNDGDNGVYQHTDIDNRADWDGSKLDSDDEGTNYKGETEHWDEFAKIKNGNGVNGTAARNAHIHFDRPIDQTIRELNAVATAEDLIEVALHSRNGGSFDIKATSSLADFGPATGYLLNGYYVTMESAGNYLAGLDGMTSTRGGKYISPEFAQKLFGAYQAGGGGIKGLWAVQQAYRTGNAAPGTQAPYWGETEYSGRMQQEGIAAGVMRR